MITFRKLAKSLITDLSSTTFHSGGLRSAFSYFIDICQEVWVVTVIENGLHKLLSRSNFIHTHTHTHIYIYVYTL